MREIDPVTDKQPRSRPVIILEPPWWRCENSNEFRCGPDKPSRCPVCGSTKVEMVTDVGPEFAKKIREGKPRE